MAKDKLTVVVPNEDKFGPAQILFGVVTGAGVPDYDNVKSKGKRGDMEYVATLALTNAENKDFRNKVLEFWDANKPKEGGDKPANFKNITRVDKDNENVFLLFSKTKTHFEIKDALVPNVVPIVNHEGTKLAPEEFGNMGKGSEGRLAVTLAVYGDDEDAGISVYLSAVKLTKFVTREGGNAASAFGAEEGEVDGAGGFKSEKKKDKDKKKPKPVDDDEDEDDEDDEPAPVKKKKKPAPVEDDDDEDETPVKVKKDKKKKKNKTA